MNIKEIRYHSFSMAQQILGGSAAFAKLVEEADKIASYIQSGSVELQTEADEFHSFFERLKIQHLVRGAIDFKPYAYQKTMLEVIEKSKRLLISNARQMGVSLTLGMHILHYALKNPNATILILEPKFNHAVDFISRIIYTITQDDTLMQTVTEMNKSVIKFNNGSSIIARAVSRDAPRGLSLDYIVINDAAFVSHSVFEELHKSLSNALNQGSKCVIASTPHMPEGLFYDLWTGGKEWNRLHLPWYLHPERNEAWAEEQTMMHERFRSEFCCEFIEDKA